MLSLATTVINFASDILASCSSAANKLSSYSFASIDQLNLNYAAFLVYSLLLSLACYFAFNSLTARKNLCNAPCELEEDAEDIKLSSIDNIVQSKPETSPEVPVTLNSDGKFESSTALVIYQPQPSQKSRRDSIKSRIKGPGDIGYVNLTFTLTGPNNNTVFALNHERISLIDDYKKEDFTHDIKEHPAQKKPFEYYLRWDLPTFELEQLSYAEKSRRFYLLSKYGEVKQEAKPPEVVQIKELPPEPIKPMNLISDLVQQANLVDIPKFQVQLLKLNHQLVLSYLNRIDKRKFCFSPANVLRGLFDFSAFYRFKKPAINLDEVACNEIKVHSNKKRGTFKLNTNRFVQVDLNIFNPKLKLLK